MDFQGERDGIWAWTRFNQLFNYLPLAALIEKKIICMHGGIGRSIHSVEQIENLKRPITMDAGSLILMDLLWYVFSFITLSAALGVSPRMIGALVARQPCSPQLICFNKV